MINNEEYIQNFLNSKRQILLDAIHKSGLSSTVDPDEIISYYNSIGRCGFNFILKCKAHDTYDYHLTEALKSMGFFVIATSELEYMNMSQADVFKHNFFDNEKEHIILCSNYLGKNKDSGLCMWTYRIDFLFDDNAYDYFHSTQLDLYTSYCNYKADSIFRQALDKCRYTGECIYSTASSDKPSSKPASVMSFSEVEDEDIEIEHEFTSQYEILFLPNGKTDIRFFKYYTIPEEIKSLFNKHYRIFNCSELNYKIEPMYANYNDVYDIVITIYNEDICADYIKKHEVYKSFNLEHYKISAKHVSKKDQVIQSLLSSYCEQGMTLEDAAIKLINRIKYSGEVSVKYHYPNFSSTEITLSTEDIFFVWQRSGKLQHIKELSFANYSKDELKNLNLSTVYYHEKCDQCGCFCNFKYEQSFVPRVFLCCKECYEKYTSQYQDVADIYEGGTEG